MRKLSSLLLALGVTLACQGYHFKSVQPKPVVLINKSIDTGVQLAPPVLIIVQDTSGSMCEPISSTDEVVDGGSCAADAGRSKMAITSNAMIQIFGQLDTASHPFNLGLYSFPSDNSCGAGTLQVPTTDAGTAIPAIQLWYATIANNVGGGTPTAQTLSTVANDPTFAQSAATSKKVLLLVTDGLPNCNHANPCASALWSDGKSHGCESPEYLSAYFGVDAGPPTGCSCSRLGCDTTNNQSTANTCCTTKFSEECLDGQASVQAIADLYQNHQVTTYVVGMGFDLKLTSGATLDAMARAGQGGNPDAGHFSADTPQQLQDALQSIITLVTESCIYNLDSPPADPRLIELVLDGTTLTQDSPNGFIYIPPPSSGGPAQVELQGTSCTQLQNGQTHSLKIHAVG
jgi:hypothetical protein